MCLVSVFWFFNISIGCFEIQVSSRSAFSFFIFDNNEKYKPNFAFNFYF